MVHQFPSSKLASGYQSSSQRGLRWYREAGLWFGKGDRVKKKNKQSKAYKQKHPGGLEFQVVHSERRGKGTDGEGRGSHGL